MRIYFSDGVAKFEDGYEPNPDERALLMAVTEALPDPPERVQINPVCEYVLVDEGFEGGIVGPGFGGRMQQWVEYAFDVQDESQLPSLKGGITTHWEMTVRKGTAVLILTRKLGEMIYIGDNVQVTVLGIKGHQVRLGIAAPKNVGVHREEIYKRIKAELSTKRAS